MTAHTIWLIVIVVAAWLTLMILFFSVLDYLKWSHNKNDGVAAEMQKRQHDHEYAMLREQQAFAADMDAPSAR